jgi:hypothetical protein
VNPELLHVLQRGVDELDCPAPAMVAAVEELDGVPERLPVLRLGFLGQI